MRWQMVSATLAVGLLAAASVSASVIDFSTDPDLAGSWTQNLYYTGATPPNATSSATWTAGNTWLDLSENAGPQGAIDALRPTASTRTDADPVTLTIKEFNVSGASWEVTGLVLSTTAAPTSASGTYQFELFNYMGAYSYRLQHEGTEIATASAIASLPSTVKLDIVRDGGAYVFNANDVEIFRDSTYGSTALPYYAMYWGGGTNSALTVKADDFGIVPEPGTLVLMATGLIGLLAYAWRKRR